MTERLSLARTRRLRVPPMIDRALSIAVLEGDNQETRRTKRLLTAGLWVALANPWPLALQLIAADAPLAALTIGASFLVAVGSLISLWLRPSTFHGVVHAVIGVNLAVAVVMTLLFGGFLESGATFVWAIALVLAGVALFNDRRAAVWLVVSVAALIVSVIASENVEPLYENPDPELSAVINTVIVLLFAYFVLSYYAHQRAELLQLSDDLLKNILPDTIADRLKDSDTMIADDYEAASVLFADVAGFTPMSADMAPNQLVALLNEVFSGFDELVADRQLEKIKTIGDAYMVAAGVPKPRSDHAHAICDLALAMQHQVASREFAGRDLLFRIGVNSGPVVAGIIGTKKFSYDLWGDAVNTASRMESSGQPGRVQITQATYDLVADEFVCEPGGDIHVKGKGTMPVWFVERRKGRTPAPPPGAASRGASGVNRN